MSPVKRLFQSTFNSHEEESSFKVSLSSQSLMAKMTDGRAHLLAHHKSGGRQLNSESLKIMMPNRAYYYSVPSKMDLIVIIYKIAAATQMTLLAVHSAAALV